MTMHIKQRGYADCGVACIAMYCNVDYERVLASVPPDVYFHGLYAGEILHAIYKIRKVKLKYIECNPNYYLRNFLDYMDNQILIFERVGNFDEVTKIHYVFVSDSNFDDPIEDECIWCEDYIRDRKDWTIIGVIK